MEPGNSTDKAEKKNRSKRYGPQTLSPEYRAVLARLRYVGEFLFGGNLATYAAAVGVTESWLKFMLREKSRVRMSTFIRFVKSGLVSAEWLFCGTGAMLTSNAITDDIGGTTTIGAINSRYQILDTGALSPIRLPEISASTSSSVSHCSERTQKLVSVARQVFISSTNAKPVILFLNAPPLVTGIADAVAGMLKNKYATGLAISLAAAETDYQLAGQTDLGVFNDVVIRAAKSGLGLGEALGAFLANRVEPEKSVLAAAFAYGAPVTVHGSIGESPLHFCPAKSGAELGAAYGATGYIDSLVFAEQVRQMAGDKTSLFLNVGSSLPGLPLLSSAMSAAQEGLGLTFERLKISRFTTKQTESALDVCVSGPYDYLMTTLLSACDAIFEGSFDVFTNKDSGEQFVAFEFLNQCAENVRERAKSAGKRKR